MSDFNKGCLDQKLHMLEEATMSEKDPSLAGMGWMGWDEVNVKIFLKHIDLILTTQEQQGPAPGVLQELRSKDCSTLLQPPQGPWKFEGMQIISSREHVGYPFLVGLKATRNMCGMNVSWYMIGVWTKCQPDKMPT